MFLQLSEEFNFNKHQKEDEGIMLKKSNILHLEKRKFPSPSGLIIVKINYGLKAGVWEGSCDFKETRDIIRDGRGTIWVYRAKQLSE